MRKNLLQILLMILSAIGLAAMPVWAADVDEKKSEAYVEIAPTVGGVAVSGNKQQFREDQWRQEGPFGGVDQFKLRQYLGNEITLSAEGRAIFVEQDYKVGVRVDKKNAWFVRMGFSEYRKYFDSAGGYFQPFPVPWFTTNNDLFLNIGDVFIEGGLNAPGLPQVLLGFDHKFKDGNKSMLEWGGATENATFGNNITRKITPASMNIDESTDTFKAQIDHDIFNVHLGNKFEYEHFSNNSIRYDGVENLNTPSSQSITVFDNYKHDAFYNNFYADSHVTDKIYLSTGYFYTNLNGTPSLLINTSPLVGATRQVDYVTNAVGVNQHANIANLNATANPFEVLTFYGGIQGSTLNTSGNTNAVLLTQTGTGTLTGPNALIASDEGKRGMEETLGIRFTGIPRTTVYAEGRYTQQGIDLFEREVDDTTLALLRYTATSVNRERWSIGFNTSPINRLTLSGRFRHDAYTNDYDNEIDNTPNNYSAFITRQVFTTNQASVKAGLRLTSWLQTSLQYQRVNTTIVTNEETLPVSSSVTSCQYHANVTSADVTVMPLERLYITGLFSYTDAITQTSSNGYPGVVPYDGSVFTTMASAAYGIDDKTKVSVQYLYSFSHDFINFAQYGLPLGLDNNRTGLTASLSRLIKKDVELKLGYGYYRYREPSSDGVYNYSANVVSGGCVIRF